MTLARQPRPSVQRKEAAPASRADTIHAAAARGIEGGGGALPHAEAIQRSFGGHDVSGVQAHLGGAATEANQAMGANAFASGNHVAFKAAPDLRTAAHEAAHVIQQQRGVSLSGGVGRVGDAYEQHADRVADLVVAGKSAEAELGAVSGKGAGEGAGPIQQLAVQMDGGGDGLQCVAPDANQSTSDGGQSTAPRYDDAGGVCTGSDPAAAQGAAAAKPAAAPSDKVEAQKTVGGKSPAGNSYGFTFKAGTDGMAGELFGKVSKSFQIPIPELPGLFAEISLSASAKATGAKKADGSIEAGGVLQGEAKFTLNYGIPKVASVYAGGKATVKLDGFKYKQPASGDGKWELPVAALKVALVLGAKLDIELGPKEGWKFISQNVIEWNPGGEFELLKVGYINGEWGVQKGADIDRLVAAIKSLGSSGQSWDARDNAGRKKASDPQRLPPGKI